MALLAVCVVGTLWLFVQLLLYRYGRDQGIYALVADAIVRGGMPYRDAWDFKPPGIFVVYALARVLLGPGQWAIRLVEALGLACTTAGFAVLSRRWFGDWRIGIVGGLLTALVHTQLEFWHTAQPESFGGMLLVWALVCATYEPPPGGEARARVRKQWAAWALAGALYAAAGLLKPPLIGGIAISACFAMTARWMRAPDALRACARRPLEVAGSERDELLDALRARVLRRAAYAAIPAGLMACGALLALGMCALWFVVKGAWGDLYETMFVFTPHYTRLGWEGVSFPGLFYLAFEEWSIGYSSINTVGILAALLLQPMAAREREGIVHMLGVIFVQLAGVAMQRKFFPYHYGSTLIAAGLLAGLGAMKLWQLALRRGVAGVVAYAALASVAMMGRTATRDTRADFMERCLTRQAWLLGARSERERDKMDGSLYSVADVNYDANRRVAEHLRQRLKPQETAFVWGFEPIIYDMAERRPASRYLYDVPQRVEWFRQEAQQHLMDDLAAQPPAAIVVEHRDVFPVVTGNALDSADSLRWFPALAGLIEGRYARDTTIEDFDIYYLKH